MAGTPKTYKTLQELFAEQSHWTQGSAAKNGSGTPVDVDSPYAACWCLVGGAHRVYGLHSAAANAALDKLRARLREVAGYRVTTSDWNDERGRTHAEVLALVTEVGV